MEFHIMSRQQARRYSFGHIDKKTIIISITDVDSVPNRFCQNPNIIGILQLQFDDVEKGESNCITEEDAKKIISFVNHYIDTAENIVVHCEAGISRSAGVCAALMKIIIDDDSTVFDNPQYCPNRSCYRAILNTYYGRCNAEEIEETFKENIESRKKAFHDFFEKYCKVCGTQRCPGDEEAIKTCGHWKEEKMPDKYYYKIINVAINKVEYYASLDLPIEPEKLCEALCLNGYHAEPTTEEDYKENSDDVWEIKIDELENLIKLSIDTQNAFTDTIEKQKKEIEGLKEENMALNENTEKYIRECENRSRKIADEYRAEIIKEFAAKLKSSIVTNKLDEPTILAKIDELVGEFGAFTS